MFIVSAAQFASVTDILQRWSIADSTTQTGYIQQKLCAPLASFRGQLITQDVVDDIAEADPDLEDLRLDMPTSDGTDNHSPQEDSQLSDTHGDADEDNYEAILDGD